MRSTLHVAYAYELMVLALPSPNKSEKFAIAKPPLGVLLNNAISK